MRPLALKVGYRKSIGDLHELGQCMHLLAQQLVLQHRAVQASVSEVLDGLNLMDPFASVSELDPPLEVLTEAFILALHAESELPR